MKKLLSVVIVVLSLMVFSSAHAVDLTFRLSQGGLRDDRAPDGILGGGQVALDVKLGNLPIVVSIASEYYKKGPIAIHPYEIHGLVVVYVLYTAPLLRKWKSNYYLGGGIGRLEVPKDNENSNAMESGIVFDAAAGINVKVFWKIGIYVEGKYIYSSKTINNIKVIDFSDVGLLVGISLNLGW